MCTHQTDRKHPQKELCSNRWQYQHIPRYQAHKQSSPRWPDQTISVHYCNHECNTSDGGRMQTNRVVHVYRRYDCCITAQTRCSKCLITSINGQTVLWSARAKQGWWYSGKQGKDSTQVILTLWKNVFPPASRS